MNLFGIKKKSTPAATNTNAAETIQLLRRNLEMLDKREQFITLKIQSSLKEAKEKALKKDKKGAIFCLKRKKMFETEIEKLQGARVTLEQQAMTLEGAALNIEVFKAVESGVNAMKSIRGNLDAARVDKIMDDIEEEKDLSDQISDAITRPAKDLFDDDELLAELAELEELQMQEELDEKASHSQKASTPSLPVTSQASILSSLPEVPHTAVPSRRTPQEEEEEAALRALQASMMS